jgi:hypothetical protein
MPEENEKKPKRSQRKPSHKWATIQEVADHFCVGRETVRAGRGVFARLRRVSLTNGRTVILRTDMERLDRDMERSAQPLTSEVVQFDEHRKTA